MEKLLYRQTEQKQMLAKLKIQIAKEIDLWQIIQTAIEDGRKLLQLDRLLIYQLDVSFDSYYSNLQPDRLLDVVTYEAKSRQDIASVLYFQEESCFRNFDACRHKYQQGFGLVIDDMDKSNLSSCLQTLMQKLQVKAKIVVPINAQGKLWGLAIAHQCFVPRQWHSEEIRFLRLLSEQLAIAIERDRSYQTLKQQIIYLEQQVKTQARQIKNALIAAQTAARSKHEFLGSMSHELRTPLTSVIGLSSTLLQSSLAENRISLPIEKQRQYLKIIQESGRHLLSLIDSILCFSEVESGNYLLNIEQISLSSLGEKVLQTLERNALEKQIELRLELKITAKQDLFSGDREKLQEILLNLIDNGIKFTNSGGKVTLKIWRETERAIFQIEDTGIGITEREIPLLFEKFKQLEDFRRRTHGGAGLGLALTKQLIELHSGTIEVRSTPKKGSVFTVYLPERNSQKQNNIRPQHISSSLTQGDNKVALVTENESNATFICKLLTAINYKVIWLVASATTIEQIELLNPKIVIVDKNSAEILEILNRKNQQKPQGDRASFLLWCSQLSAREWQIFSAKGVKDFLLETMSSVQIIDKIEALNRENK